MGSCRPVMGIQVIEDFATIVVHVASEKPIPLGLQKGSLAGTLFMNRGQVSRQELEKDLTKAMMFCCR